MQRCSNSKNILFGPFSDQQPPRPPPFPPQPFFSPSLILFPPLLVLFFFSLSRAYFWTLRERERELFFLPPSCFQFSQPDCAPISLFFFPLFFPVSLPHPSIPSLSVFAIMVFFPPRLAASAFPYIIPQKNHFGHFDHGTAGRFNQVLGGWGGGDPCWTICKSTTV